MKIHEYQAKAILARYGVPVPRGEVAFNADRGRRHRPPARRRHRRSSRRRFTPAAAARAAASSSRSRRTKPRQLARAMIGMTLVTHQTGPEGRVVVARAGRGRAADDARAVSEHRARSRVGQAGDDGQRRRRHGHRGGGRGDAREDLTRLHRAGRRPGAVRGAPARVRDRPRRRRR